jgi:hypothetical protein
MSARNMADSDGTGRRVRRTAFQALLSNRELLDASSPTPDTGPVITLYEYELSNEEEEEDGEDEEKDEEGSDVTVTLR